MDGGSVLLTQPIAQGPIPFLPTPEGGGILGDFSMNANKDHLQRRGRGLVRCIGNGSNRAA